jgi:hypothetical protein
MIRIMGSSYLLRLFSIFPITALLLINSVKCQENGILGGRVINRAGDRLNDAAVELYSSKDMQMMYSTRTNEDGEFRVTGIADGTYNLQIKIPGTWAYSRFDIKIAESREVNLGTISITGYIADCSAPGMKCASLSDTSGLLPLPRCSDNLKLLLSGDGKPDLLEDNELRRRAIVQVSPNWPINAQPGYTATILVVIGTDGRVFCADILGQDDANMQAALIAAKQWRFQPILDKGAPIAAIGELTFEVPQRSK